MFRWWRQCGRSTRFVAILCVAMSLLLVNAISIAPADHDHGPEHDEHDCLTCILAVHGAWAPSATVSPAVMHTVATLAPTPSAYPQCVAELPQPPVRGPPARA